MKSKQLNEDDKKVTNEKPVPIAPLGFKEALAGLSKIKPKPKKSDKY